MKIYRTERMVTECEVNEEEFLEFLKKDDPDDEVIQNAQTLDDVLEEYVIDDFDTELLLFTEGGDTISYHSGIYYDKEDAFRDMEFGIH